MLISPFLDLLNDAGIHEHGVTERLTHYQISCCGDVWIHGGYYVCSKCGKVLNNLEMVHEPMYKLAESGQSVNTGIQPIKRRFYKIRTHFRTHLKQYMDCVPTPETPHINFLTEIDAKDRGAYTCLKKQLKQQRRSDLYKEIWHLVYKLGGYRPQISVRVYQALQQHFEQIEYFFRYSWHNRDRHNVPSVGMLLTLLLEYEGHEPYYVFPTLKSRGLRLRVYDFWDSYVAFIRNQRYA